MVLCSLAHWNIEIFYHSILGYWIVKHLRYVCKKHRLWLAKLLSSTHLWRLDCEISMCANEHPHQRSSRKLRPCKRVWYLTRTCAHQYMYHRALWNVHTQIGALTGVHRCPYILKFTRTRTPTLFNIHVAHNKGVKPTSQTQGNTLVGWIKWQLISLWSHALRWHDLPRDLWTYPCSPLPGKVGHELRTTLPKYCRHQTMRGFLRSRVQLGRELRPFCTTDLLLWSRDIQSSKL